MDKRDKRDKRVMTEHEKGVACEAATAILRLSAAKKALQAIMREDGQWGSCYQIAQQALKDNDNISVYHINSSNTNRGRKPNG